jgi:hypothetical protein
VSIATAPEDSPLVAELPARECCVQVWMICARVEIGAQTNSIKLKQREKYFSRRNFNARNVPVNQLPDKASPRIVLQRMLAVVR